MGSLVLSILIVIPLYFVALIPQIIKKYEYFLVPYITAENPNITPNRALEISSKTMKGEKMHCFGLQMSFIGWLILGGLAGSIFTAFLGVLLGSAATAAGMALIYPYLYATLAEFYCCMKEKAIATGISSRDELDGLYGRAANAQPFGQPMATPIIRATSHINPLLPLSLLTTDFSVSQKETIMMTTTTDLR